MYEYRGKFLWDKNEKSCYGGITEHLDMGENILNTST